METQDHKKPKQQGNEGHSGGSVHVCSKCGWPFPNPHPSAKQRRAHKKACGTIEGFKLDNNDSQNNTLMMGDSVSDRVSDDEHKPPSVTPVERTVSRRSNSGVGSRSSRSNRSEDDVFTDAVTDFNDGSSSGEVTDGGMQRFYSLQRVTQGDLDDMKEAAENASADNLCIPDVLPKGSQDQGQTVHSLEGETDRVEAGYISPEINSSSASGLALIPDLVTVEHDNKVDTSDESKELVSSKKLELKTTYNDTAEEASEKVSAMNTVDEVVVGPYGTGETTKSTGLESTGSENNLEKSEVVYAPHTIHSLDHPVGVIDASNGNLGKTSAVEDHGSQTEVNENVYVLAVPSDLPLRQNPDVAIEDLDHKGGKSNGLQVPDPAEDRGYSEESSAQALEEVGAGIDLKIVDNENFSPEDVRKSDDGMENELKRDVKQNTVVEERTVGDSAQLSDVIKASDTGIEPKTEMDQDFKTENLEEEKVSFAKAEKPIASEASVFPEGSPGTDAAANLDITYETSDASGSVENNSENLILQAVEESDMLKKELSGSSSLVEAECAISGIPPRVSEPSNVYDINDTGNDEKIGVVQTHLDGNKVSAENDGNEAVTTERTPACDSSTVGSHGSIHEPLESEKIYDHENSGKSVDSGDKSVGNSLPMDNTVGSSVGAGCVGEDGPGANSKGDDIPGSISSIPSDTLEVRGDPQQHFQSSAAVNGNGMKNSAEEVSGANEGDRTLNQHVAVSAGDVLPDSSSLSDSLEGNWGSASVLSTISDTPPATPPAEENASLELKPVMKSQQYESKTLDEPQVGIETKEGASEIETLEEHQHKGSALQTAWSSSVTHADNVSSGGKRDEEIVSKVTDWSADKNHTPLKTLLGEATARSRAESPVHNQMKPRADEIPVAKNGFPKTENVNLSSNVTSSEGSKEEMGQEWNSPARYPVNIKTEKRKTKGKPYWAPFLCCSSVNAR